MQSSVEFTKDFNGVKILIHKKQALMIALLAGLAVLSPATADDQKNQDSINVGTSKEDGKTSIKKVRRLGDKEFSYKNSDNNIILIKCNTDKILVKYWYVPKIDSSSQQETSNKMQWHRAAPKSKAQRESKSLCDYIKNERNNRPIKHKTNKKSY